MHFPTVKHFEWNSRLLLSDARQLAQGYFRRYNEQIPTAQLVQRVAGVMQEYTQSGYVYLDTLSFKEL